MAGLVPATSAAAALAQQQLNTLGPQLINATVQEWTKRMEDERQKGKGFFGFGGSKLTPMEFQMGEMVMRLGAHVVAQDLEMKTMRETTARTADQVNDARQALSQLEVKREVFVSEAMAAAKEALLHHVELYEHRARRQPNSKPTAQTQPAS
jgi:hypothetical protein